MEQEFAAPWDRLLVGISLVAGPLLALLPPIVMRSAILRLPPDQTGYIVWLVACGLAGPVVTALTFAWAPRRYRVTPRAIVIQRWVGAVVIDRHTIRRVTALDAADLKGSLRLWGSGGLFGYYGRYWNRRLGHFRLYATQRRELVVIEADRTYVVSPHAADAFIEAARQGGYPAERTSS